MSRRKQKEENLVLGRILYSLLIVVLYLFGKNIPIPWIAADSAGDSALSGQNFIAGVLGGTNENRSILMLGIMPYMTASVIVSIFTQGARSRQHTVSPQRVQKATLTVALIISLLQGLIRSLQLVTLSLQANVLEYQINVTYVPLEYVLLTTLVLTSGAFVTIFLMDRNSRWGIGGSSLLIFVNILDSGRQNIVDMAGYLEQSVYGGASIRYRLLMIVFVAAAALAILLITILFEESDVRLPVRHIMINNAYAEKDYIAIKLNPIGTMPIMYVMSFYVLPVYILQALSAVFPDNSVIANGIRIWNLNNTVGIVIFAVMLMGITILMSMFMINPKDMTENLMKSGDYIEGFDPGEETEKEISHAVLFAALLSSLIMILTAVVPMLVGAAFGIPSELTSIPMTGMIIAGLTAQMTDQVRNLQTMQKYRPFL